MRKWVPGLLAVVLAFALAGCAGGSSAGKSLPDSGGLSGEITFWHSFTQGQRQAAIEDAVEKFQELHPGVKINVETMDWADFKKRWKAGVETGDLPDISTACNMFELEELAHSGLLQPVDEVIDAIGRDRFSDSVLADLAYNGSSYGLPYYSHAYTLWYRTDLLAKAHREVPATWDDFAATAQALTVPAQDVYGFIPAFSTDDFTASNLLHMYALSAGDSLIRTDGTANLTSDAVREGIRYWCDLYRDCAPAEAIDYGVYEQAAAFYSGRSALDFNSGFHVTGVQGTRPDLLGSIACAPLPKVNADDPDYSAIVTHIPLVMYEDAESPEVCRAFLAFLFEDENYVEFLDSAPVGMLPSIRNVSNTEAYQANDLRRQFSSAEQLISLCVAEGHPMGFENGANNHAGIIASSGVIEAMFHRILEDGVSVEKASAEAEEELNERFAAADAQDQLPPNGDPASETAADTAKTEDQ